MYLFEQNNFMQEQTWLKFREVLLIDLSLFSQIDNLNN